MSELKDTDGTTETLLRKFFEQNPRGYFSQEELETKIRRDQSSISRTIPKLVQEGYLREDVLIEGKARTHLVGRSYPKIEISALAMRYWLRPNLYEYVFGFDLKKVRRIAMISRVRYEGGMIAGFQREAQRQWINELALKLKAPTSFVTDPITLFLDRTKVTWTPVKVDASPGDHQPEIGILTIPYSENFSELEKPAILIDGQQRTFAAELTDRDSIPILVTGYLEDLSDYTFLVSEFIKNNSHKNLPSDLLDILAPKASTEVIPKRIGKRLSAAELAQELNDDPNSPFFKMIKSPANPSGTIALRSIIDFIAASQRSGYLQGISSDEQKTVLVTYWQAVANVFPEAWKKPPEESKLTHGAGMFAMGALMDQILPAIKRDLWTPNAVRSIEKELNLIAHRCLWTEPDPTDEDKTKDWNENWKKLQNVARDKTALAMVLKRFYNEASRS